MATSRKILKVFLASPSDMAPERGAAKQVVDGYNKRWADHLGIQVELVGWEDTVSQMGRPQAIINQDLDQCEVFIGMMWKHWGSSPDKDSRNAYTSGFEEEFERSSTSHAATGRPEISLLFKAIDASLVKDAGDSLQKVLAFRKRITESKNILFQEFNSPEEFVEKIGAVVVRYVQRVRVQEQKKILEESSAEASDGAQGNEASSVPALTPLGVEGANFLREFVAKTEKDRRTNPILPEEIARFRLLSGLMRSQGNDEGQLGVHDANILFAKRDVVDLGLSEIHGLIDSGLENFSQHVVPLWHWYMSANADKSDYLSFEAYIGSSDERVGALGALRFLGQPIKPPSLITGESDNEKRSVMVRSFFSDGTPDSVRVAALNYLALYGEGEDLPIVRQELDRGNYQTVGPATQAFLRLQLKQSRVDAISALLELQSESVDDDLVDELFDKPTGIETDLLVKGVTHRSAKVRKTVAGLLVSRKALSVSVAEKLLEDTDAGVRYWALRGLTDSGREYSDERIRAILIKSKGSAGLGSLFAPTIPDKEGEAQFDRYLREKLRKLNVATLERLEAAETVVEQDARLALDFRRFSGRATALRASVDSKFKVDFDARLEDLKIRLGVDSETVKRVVSLENILRREFTRKALDLLCEKNEVTDLTRIRAALQEGFVEFNERDLEYMSRHGSWDDVLLLISLVDRTKEGNSLLLLLDDGKIKPLAEAIRSIARNRIADLLMLTMRDRLRAAIVARISEKEVASISDDEILKHFISTNDSVRRTMVIKVIRSVPKARLKTLLQRYYEIGQQRYYNVIHWMDAGVSLPKGIVGRATSRLLTKD